jgi:hypothetical protein
MSDKTGYFAERFEAQTKRIMDLQEAKARARTWPEESSVFPPHTTEWRMNRRLERIVELEHYYPENESLRAEVCRRPDDDEPRHAYAAWMARQPALVAAPDEDGPGDEKGDPTEVSRFIEVQLSIAEGYRRDSRFDPQPILDAYDECTASDSRFGIPEWGHFDLDDLQRDGVIDHLMFFRGFVEHVGIKAKYFLPFADELYFLAPIRYLTLTYITDHVRELAASPHLAQIRSLTLRHRMTNNHYTRLNELTDDQVRLLAGSPHLRGLRHLDLEDAVALTPRALDHLAMSPHLTSLSCVTFDISHYHRALGQFGKYLKTLSRQPVLEWRAELEARHGYLPWLHADDHYRASGANSPDPEAPVEHPVGDAAFRPDIAARMRPRLPTDVALALQACLTATGELRERSLVVPLATDRLVATLERAVPDPALPDARALVTLTVQQLTHPLPAYDHALARAVELRPRTTATLGVPLP